CIFFFFFSSRRRHTRFSRDWSSDVCSSDLDEFFRDSLLTLPDISKVGAEDYFSYLETMFGSNLGEAHRPFLEHLIAIAYLKKMRSEERRVGKECRTRRLRK